MYKVLIVEDEDIIRNGLTYMVDWPKLNCIVVGRAADGIEGLAKIKEPAAGYCHYRRENAFSGWNPNVKAK